MMRFTLWNNFSLHSLPKICTLKMKLLLGVIAALGLTTIRPTAGSHFIKAFFYAAVYILGCFQH